MTLQQAREKASTMLASLYSGADPYLDRKRQSEEPRVRDLARRYMEEHARINCKPSTADGYQRILNKYILPALGDYRVSKVERKDIANLHHSLASKPCEANRVLEIISKMFNLAELWGLRPDGSNPRRHIQKFKEKKRERYLDRDELQRLSKTLQAAEEARLISPYAIAAFRVLILTGARLSEIQFCKWQYVDLNQGVIRLPDSKTGAKTIHLGQLTVAAFRAIPKIEGNPYVICSEKYPDKPINDLQSAWQQIREWADLPNVRIHDLRHTFASHAVNMGESLPMIGKLLGHTQAQTTARYAHLAVSPLIDAASRVTEKMGEVFNVPTIELIEDVIEGEYEIVEEPKAETSLIQRLGNGAQIQAPQFMTSDEAAQWLGVNQRLMENWRWRKVGPRYTKIGNRIRYTLTDLREFSQCEARIA